MRIEFGPRSEDRYGRALFYVYTEAGESVAEKLIREGLGKSWEQDGQHRELLMAAGLRHQVMFYYKGQSCLDRIMDFLKS